MRLVLALTLVACGGAARKEAVATVPTTGVYQGTYSVPVTEDLKASATYAVNELEWSYANGVATLGYKLPVELLGRSQRVSFTGPFDATTLTGRLTSEDGTAECKIVDRTVECLEDMHALMPIEHDLDRVTELAPASIATERVRVTRVFISDPIGIATLAF